VNTGTVTVVGEFSNPDMLLLPGMFVRVRALLNVQNNALVVPPKAVMDLQGRTLIAVVSQDNKVSVRPIHVGEQLAEQWVVSGDIQAGDRVIVEGIQKVKDGSPVRPVRATPHAGSATQPAAGESNS
jgi:membrane fusion protein (multidrug efflux system)